MAPPPPVPQLVEEADKIHKRQATAEAKVDACLNLLIEQVTLARDELLFAEQQKTRVDVEDLVAKLRSVFDSNLKEASSATKELHSAIGRLGKLLDASGEEPVDLGKVMRQVSWNPVTLHTIIAEHFFRQGRFEVGHKMCEEAGLRHGVTLAAPFISMHEVLKHIHSRNLGPALQWAATQLILLDMGALSPGCPPQSPSLVNWRQQPATNRQQPPSSFGTGILGVDGGGYGSGIGPTSAASLVAKRNTAAAQAQIRSFQFQLHQMNFLDSLFNYGQPAALRYARDNFSAFATSHMHQIQKLMGCMVFHTRAIATGKAAPAHQDPMSTSDDVKPGASDQGVVTAGTDADMTDASSTGMGLGVEATGKQGQGQAVQQEVGVVGGTATGMSGIHVLVGTPYEKMGSLEEWEALVTEFLRLACNLVGMPAESPLATVTAAGAAALPSLHKMVSLLSPGVANEIRGTDQLLVELDLGVEFVFHPIFACPVSRDQSTPDNPPLLLPCSHVLCKQSVYKIAKSRTRIFKCPYCPVEAQVDNLRELVFPAVV